MKKKGCILLTAALEMSGKSAFRLIQKLIRKYLFETSICEIVSSFLILPL
jgi:hypothetical protein